MRRLWFLTQTPLQSRGQTPSAALLRVSFHASGLVPLYWRVHVRLALICVGTFERYRLLESDHCPQTASSVQQKGLLPHMSDLIHMQCNSTTNAASRSCCRSTEQLDSLSSHRALLGVMAIWTTIYCRLEHTGEPDSDYIRSAMVGGELLLPSACTLHTAQLTTALNSLLQFSTNHPV